MTHNYCALTTVSAFLKFSCAGTRSLARNCYGVYFQKINKINKRYQSNDYSRLEDIRNTFSNLVDVTNFFFQLSTRLCIHFYSTRSFHFPKNPTTIHNNIIIIIVSERFRAHRCDEESHLIRGNRFSGSTIVQQQ